MSVSGAQLWVQRAIRQTARARWTSLVHHATEVLEVAFDEGVRTDCGHYMAGHNSGGELLLDEERPTGEGATFCTRCLAIVDRTPSAELRQRSMVRGTTVVRSDAQTRR